MKVPSLLIVSLMGILFTACVPTPGDGGRADYGYLQSAGFHPSGSPSSSASYLPAGSNNYSFGSPGGSSPASNPSRIQSGGGYPSTTYSSDYKVDRTLGGNPRVSDRWGNSTTYEQALGGGYRSTSNTGETMTYSQTLGGGLRATSSSGTTYQGRQTLGGGYTELQEPDPPQFP